MRMEMLVSPTKTSLIETEKDPSTKSKHVKEKKIR